jgi:capsular polysaccharide export protein
LQSLYHKTPVIALGECLYDVPDLVFTGTLEQFWHHPGEVDGDLFQRFREHMIRETQLNASFYADTPGLQPYIKPVNRADSAAEAPVAKAQNDAWSASTLPTLK